MATCRVFVKRVVKNTTKVTYGRPELWVVDSRILLIELIIAQ